jgi:hypothetical protein
MTMTKDQTIKIMMPITLTTVKETMILEGKRVGHRDDLLHVDTYELTFPEEGNNGGGGDD